MDDNIDSIITCNQQPPCHIKYTEDKTVQELKSLGYQKLLDMKKSYPGK